MRPQLAALFALGSLISVPARAADKIKIEIVEAVTTIQQLDASHFNFLFSAKAILPDGSHAALACGAGDKGCAGIESFSPEKMPVGSKNCTSTDSITTCTTVNLGFYWAKRDGNELLIEVPKAKRRYRIVGSWQ